MRQALVTLAIGDAYLRRWQLHVRDSWDEYAKRHGFEVIALTDPLDTSERAQQRSPAWQKLLILKQSWAASYDRLVWVDSDIFMNPRAPSILEGLPPEKIGIATENDFFWHPLFGEPLRRKLLQGTDRWKQYGFEDAPRIEYNTGVLVLEPRHHADVLKYVYDHYEERGVNYENWPLAYEIHRRGLAHQIDPKFNIIVLLVLSMFTMPSQAVMAFYLRELYHSSYWLHFAGSGVQRMTAIMPKIAQQSDNDAVRDFKKDILIELSQVKGLSDELCQLLIHASEMMAKES